MNRGGPLWAFWEARVWSRRVMSGWYILWFLGGWREPLGARRDSFAAIVPQWTGFWNDRLAVGQTSAMVDTGAGRTACSGRLAGACPVRGTERRKWPFSSATDGLVRVGSGGDAGGDIAQLPGSLSVDVPHLCRVAGVVGVGLFLSSDQWGTSLDSFGADRISAFGVCQDRLRAGVVSISDVPGQLSAVHGVVASFGDRGLAGATAPPHGLFLMEVKY